MHTTHNNITTETIEQLLQKHHNIGLLDYFKKPLSERGPMFIPVFADVVGDIEFKSTILEKQIAELNTHISNNEERSRRMEAFLGIIDDLRHTFTQEHPEIAKNHITKEELTRYIDITFGISKPETLFYNTKVNEKLISHLFDMFSGHRYNKEIDGLVTYMSGYPDAKIAYPDQPLEKLESLNDLMEAMKEAVSQTQINLKNDHEQIVEIHKYIDTRDRGEEQKR